MGTIQSVLYICFDETYLTFCIENSPRLGEEEEEKESDDEEEYAPSESGQSEVEPEEEEGIQAEPTVEEKVVEVIMPPKKRRIHWKTG